LHLWDQIVLQADRLYNEERKDAKSRIARETRLSLLAKLKALSSLTLLKVVIDNQTSNPIGLKIKDFVILGTAEELDREGSQASG
jgi:hypothetical protein